MRLLHTSRLQFEEFYDHQVPHYAILSHRWGPIDQEVSYADFLSGQKKSTPGYAKILQFCDLARRQRLEYCWLDVCCIDKTSSAELSEAINSMYRWYENAAVCDAYLEDVSSPSRMQESEWFSRGWTLQELIAPATVEFFDKTWKHIGSKRELTQRISQVTGINERLLALEEGVGDYSVAQIMSWASRRSTTRLEDEAYCLIGLFGINMPLLYGEGSRAFRRLQEEILANGRDNSLFAWGMGMHFGSQLRQPSILAPSPASFTGCGDIRNVATSQRILFEVTNRGMMVLIHQSFDLGTLRQLLMQSAVNLGYEKRLFVLTLPLGCCRRRLHTTSKTTVWRTDDLFLQLITRGGSWRRLGIISGLGPEPAERNRRPYFFAYPNDYVRLYIHDEHVHWHGQGDLTLKESQGLEDREIRYFHLREDTSTSIVASRAESAVGWEYIPQKSLLQDHEMKVKLRFPSSRHLGERCSDKSQSPDE